MKFNAWCIALMAGMLAFSPARAHEASSGGVTVAHPWLRATPGGATVGAAYMEIKSGPKTSDRLIEIKTDVAARSEIHETIDEDGVMKMRRVEALEVPPASSVVLKPSGKHVMLIDLARPLVEGDLVKLTLIFEKAGPIEIEAGVEPIGATGPHGFEAQPTSEPSHEHHH